MGYGPSKKELARMKKENDAWDKKHYTRKKGPLEFDYSKKKSWL